jgi:hypothetical protein
MPLGTRFAIKSLRPIYFSQSPPKGVSATGTKALNAYTGAAEEAIGRDVRQLVYPGLAEQFEQTEQSTLERGETLAEVLRTE